MERKHGYSLDDIFIEISNEEKELIFDKCDCFLEHPQSGTELESDWLIFFVDDEQTPKINLLDKKSGKTYSVFLDYERQQEKETERIWAEICEEERKYDEEVKAHNDSIINEIKTSHGDEFVKSILECAEASEVHGKWEIVNFTKGTWQEDDFGSIKGLWVDQWCNGGHVGDDFQGDIYIEIGKERYLKMTYAC